MGFGGGAIFVTHDEGFDFFAIPNFDADKVLFAPLNVATFFSPICLTLDAARTKNMMSIRYGQSNGPLRFTARSG